MDDICPVAPQPSSSGTKKEVEKLAPDDVSKGSQVSSPGSVIAAALESLDMPLSTGSQGPPTASSATGIGEAPSASSSHQDVAAEEKLDWNIGKDDEGGSPRLEEGMPQAEAPTARLSSPEAGGAPFPKSTSEASAVSASAEALKEELDVGGRGLGLPKSRTEAPAAGVEMTPDQQEELRKKKELFHKLKEETERLHMDPKHKVAGRRMTQNLRQQLEEPSAGGRFSHLRRHLEDDDQDDPPESDEARKQGPQLPKSASRPLFSSASGNKIAKAASTDYKVSGIFSMMASSSPAPAKAGKQEKAEIEARVANLQRKFKNLQDVNVTTDDFPDPTRRKSSISSTPKGKKKPLSAFYPRSATHTATSATKDSLSERKAGWMPGLFPSSSSHATQPDGEAKTPRRRSSQSGLLPRSSTQPTQLRPLKNGKKLSVDLPHSEQKADSVLSPRPQSLDGAFTPNRSRFAPPGKGGVSPRSSTEPSSSPSHSKDAVSSACPPIVSGRVLKTSDSKPLVIELSDDEDGITEEAEEPSQIGEGAGTRPLISQSSLGASPRKSKTNKASTPGKKEAPTNPLVSHKSLPLPSMAKKPAGIGKDSSRKTAKPAQSVKKGRSLRKGKQGVEGREKRGGAEKPLRGVHQRQLMSLVSMPVSRKQTGVEGERPHLSALPPKAKASSRRKKPAGAEKGDDELEVGKKKPYRSRSERRTRSGFPSPFALLRSLFSTRN